TWSPAKLNIFPAQPRTMIRMKHRRFDSLTTPNHRWLLEGAGRRGGRPHQKANHHFKTTDQLASSGRGRIVSGGGTYAGMATSAHADEFVELVGWVITEGCYASVGNGIQVAQSHSHNPQHVERLQMLADYFRKSGAT